MDTAKIYFDAKGNQKTIWQMVRDEPEWTANRLQEGEKAISEINCLKTLNAELVGAVRATRKSFAINVPEEFKGSIAELDELLAKAEAQP